MRQSRGLIKRLPCVKGFASVRSTLAGVAETGSETAQRLEGFASVRSTLAGVAETGCKKTIPHRLRRSSLYTRDLQVCGACLQASPRGVRKPRSGWRDLRVCEARLQASPRRVRKPRSGWRVVKKQSLTAFGGAPFTQGSLKNLYIIPDN